MGKLFILSSLLIFLLLNWLENFLQLLLFSFNRLQNFRFFRLLSVAVIFRSYGDLGHVREVSGLLEINLEFLSESVRITDVVVADVEVIRRGSWMLRGVGLSVAFSLSLSLRLRFTDLILFTRLLLLLLILRII